MADGVKTMAELPEYHSMSRAQLKPYIDRAAALHDPAGPQCKDPVEITGEDLSEPIYWQGRQWAVTSYGVEQRDGTYYIDEDRLWERDGTDWVEHMAEKIWIDLPDFVEALRVARKRLAGHSI